MKGSTNGSMNIGENYEKAAAALAERNGLLVLERNFSCKLGEIDLICMDGDSVVFIEVRFRSHPQFGSAAASVTSAKRGKLVRCAQLYLRQRPELGQRACRFDVLAFTGTGGKGDTDVRWIKNAFTM